ncbi:MAG: hypothetical protein AAF687_03625 [Pseudomonadota bacterium]
MRVEALSIWKTLRRGWLFRCKSCQEVWHLDGAGRKMTHVSSARLPLVLEWDEQPVALPKEVEAMLAEIKATPPDIYGNGSERRVTPCKVITAQREYVDPAMICIQLDAPVQNYANFRSGNEIVEIEKSELALPYDVRLACSEAEEISMAFSPSLIEMPDGTKFAFNGMTSFMSKSGYLAKDARPVPMEEFTQANAPEILQSPQITYFFVDGDPGWVKAPEALAEPPASERRQSWFQRLLGR